jgi:hypothetical protein
MKLILEVSNKIEKLCLKLVCDLKIKQIYLMKTN